MESPFSRIFWISASASPTSPLAHSLSESHTLPSSFVRWCQAEKLEKLDSIFFVVYLISVSGVFAGRKVAGREEST